MGDGLMLTLLKNRTLKRWVQIFYDAGVSLFNIILLTYAKSTKSALVVAIVSVVTVVPAVLGD